MRVGRAEKRQITWLGVERRILEGPRFPFATVSRRPPDAVDDFFSLSHSFSFSFSFSLFFLLLPAIAKNRSLFFVLLPRSFSFASILREIPRQDRVRRNYPPSPVSAPIFLLFLALSFALFLSFLAAIEVSCRTGREKCPDSNSLFLARPRDRRQRENGS